MSIKKNYFLKISMNINYTLADIINTDFITGYRAYDVCHNKSDVIKIRSINDPTLDIISHSNVFYNEESVNGQKIPYIYGDINSFINFPDIIKYTKYTICAITKYIGNDINKKNNILNIKNISNKITSIGHQNNWAGIIEYKNSSTSIIQKSAINYNDDWLVSCISYDSSTENALNGEILLGTKKDPNGINISKLNDIKAIIGKLYINDINNTDNLNSSWALSHLLVWGTNLPADKLRIVFNSFIDYLSYPAKNDIILYKNIYPRTLPTCTEKFTVNSMPTINISPPLWAGYYAGNYNSQTNELPDVNGNPFRNITSNMIKNVRLNNNSSIPFIYGGKDAYIIFPENSINSNFTICAITKYISNDEKNNNMILQSIDNVDNNLFYHGHYKNKKGVISYNNYEFSKGYPANTPVNSWVVSCAKNTNSTNQSENVFINNVNCGLLIEQEYIQKSRKNSTLTINYNNITNNSYNSMWALSYILIWDTHLSDMDLKSISNSLNNFISKGETVSFLNTSSQPSSSSSSSLSPSQQSLSLSPSQHSLSSSQLQYQNSFYDNLKLSEIQKLMLRSNN
jgi:hypothetical protein